MSRPAPPTGERPPPGLRSVLRNLEARILLLVAAGSGAVWAFLALGGEMQEGETLGLDRRLILMLRRPGDPAAPIGPAALQTALRDMTALGGVMFMTLLTLLAVLELLVHRRRREAVVLAVTVAVSALASNGLKALYGRPRPELVPHGTVVNSPSFPSGHSMISTSVYLTLAVIVAGAETRTAGKLMAFGLAIFLMLAVGFSRVYLAVHWPSDVLAGWCAGSAAAMAAWAVLTFRRRADVEGSPKATLGGP